MIEVETVLKNFMSISNTSEEEAHPHINLIKIATNFVNKAIKPGVNSSQENINLLSMLAASIAYYEYVLIQEANNSILALKIGETSANSNFKNSISAAKNLRDNFISSASHLIYPPNFIFRPV